MCPNCLLNHEDDEGKYYERSEAIRLEAIKMQILSKLGLSAKPNISATSSLPRELVLQTLVRANEGPTTPVNEAANEDNEATNTDDFYATTSEIIAFAEPGTRLNGQRLVEFVPPGEGPELRVKSAVLWVRLEPRSHSSIQRNVTLWAFRLTTHHLPNATHLSGKEFSTYTEVISSLRVSSTGWAKLDIRSTVVDWYSRRSSSRLRVLIDCSGCSRYLAPALFQSGAANRPFLVVRTEPALARRVRRRALDCTGATRGQCCKQRFYVSFKKLGWDDWVIAPSGYYANYCRGDCSGHRTPDTFLNHYTHVIEEVRKMDRLAGLQPCCAPIKFSSTSLIYYGPDMTIIKRDLPKMVVEECGCP
ncbi:inhibin beta chain-like isoform X2 [Rhodnius prolixus]